MLRFLSTALLCLVSVFVVSDSCCALSPVKEDAQVAFGQHYLENKHNCGHAYPTGQCIKFYDTSEFLASSEQKNILLIPIVSLHVDYELCSTHISSTYCSPYTSLSPPSEAFPHLAYITTRKLLL